ncbi:hypothetical protein DID88_002368 [Monilinia fructigena]|uniref:Cell surface spherulin 4-like protein n=1 Tax=Monilinia fructigena TaxID=38457 RepID=A0A395ICP1_9HELO|nr:hypothetical protein DID88_002368 [Monilinia fructigena]
MVLLTSILLPLYMYPKPGDWNWVTKAITAYPSVNFDIIINPHSGPGPINTFPDPNYLTAIAAFNAFDNTNLLGYVDTDYMHRETRDVVAEVDTYDNWATHTPENIHITGIFFDDCVSNWNTTTSASMSSIATQTHARNLSVALNPGVIADPAFFNIADRVLMVENRYDATKALASVGVVPANEHAKSSVMFYGFSGTVVEQEGLVKEIVGAGIGSLYVTTVDYVSESALWMQFVAAVDGCR